MSNLSHITKYIEITVRAVINNVCIARIRAAVTFNDNMNTQTIYYSNAFCGAGKTEWAVKLMGKTPGRYIYAVDRTEEFNDRTKRIVSKAIEAGVSVPIHSLSSKAGNSVSQDFPFVIERYSHEDHVVVIITHEAMKIVDHSVVEGLGWSIIVDEDPKIWSSASFDLGASSPFWLANYTLEPFTTGYSTIHAKADAPSWRALMADDLTRPMAAFHNRIKRNGAIVNLEAWEELERRQRLTYYALWDVTELAVYDRAVILANSFDSLITFRLIRSLSPSVSLQPIAIVPDQVWQGRDLTINYMAEDHCAGSTFFETTEAGRLAVEEWSKWIRLNVQAKDHYWAANKKRGDLKLPGQQVSPKIAGSNEYRNLTQCSILYSAKANDAENALFAALSNGRIDRDAVRRDREFEDLIQIVFRSSLRLSDDTRSVMVTVYDKEQATFLADYFKAAGFPFRTNLEFIDLGLTRQKEKPGRKADPLKPPKTAAQRAADYRARKAAA